MREIYRLTPIHHWHQENGAKFVLEEGWKRVESYGDSNDEVTSASTTVGICDVSPLTKIDLQGRDIVSFLTKVIPQSPIPNPGFHNRGRFPGDTSSSEIHMARLTAERILVFGGANIRHQLLYRLTEVAIDMECLHVTDLTSAYAAFRLAGPLSMDVLKKLCPINLETRAFPSGQCAQTPLARVGSVILRDDFLGLMSYLVLVSRDYGEYVWRSVIGAGHKYRIRPFGLTAERRFIEGVGSVATL